MDFKMQKCALSNQLSTCIKSKRENIGMTQQQLADLVGISRYSIMRYESGEREATFSVLVKIFEVLGMNLKDFVTQGVEK